jgi:hypothetical protein
MPCASGGESCTRATSRGIRRDVKSPGMSDRKTGMKSARPSAMGFLSAGPVKSETEKMRPA